MHGPGTVIIGGLPAFFRTPITCRQGGLAIASCFPSTFKVGWCLLSTPSRDVLRFGGGTLLVTTSAARLARVNRPTTRYSFILLILAPS
ncbi:hypothetical protein Moror_5891 [Moniliophthora roreri MCA 2997]|uniref:Uncharacterized protein n=1 Tax=Moniliophthora roreri (strain MCA 2997) TaxID=1381753 RepID=V2WEZ2_MONRO|nr:hypothetical protein Moror_5891 [Moniliophthora roreri MCA 2997]